MIKAKEKKKSEKQTKIHKLKIDSYDGNLYELVTNLSARERAAVGGDARCFYVIDDEWR